MSIVSDFEFIEQAARTINSLEMQYGKLSIAGHAAVDIIHAVYGCLQCPIYLKIQCGENDKAFLETRAECDIPFGHKGDPLTHNLHLRAPYKYDEHGNIQLNKAGRPIKEDHDIWITVHPLLNQDTLDPENDLLKALVTDQRTEDALRACLDALVHERTSIKTHTDRQVLVQQVEELSELAGRPFSYDFIESRVNAILSRFQENKFLVAKDILPPDEKGNPRGVERVWVAMKLNRSRTVPVGSSKEVQDRHAFTYTMRLVPSENQIEAAAKVNNISPDAAEELLKTPFGAGARSPYDSPAESGFLTTRTYHHLSADAFGNSVPRDPRTQYASFVTDADQSRQQTLRRLYDRMLDTGQPEATSHNHRAYEVTIPLHINGAPYLCARVTFTYANRHSIIAFYSEIIPVLSSQLRQAAHDAMLADLEHRLGHVGYYRPALGKEELTSQISLLAQLVQTAFPMPAWHYKAGVEPHLMFSPSPLPRYWRRIHFQRSDAEQDALFEEIAEVFRSFNLMGELRRGSDPYLARAQEMADNALDLYQLRGPAQEPLTAEKLRSTFQPKTEIVTPLVKIEFSGNAVVSTYIYPKGREIYYAIVLLACLVKIIGRTNKQGENADSILLTRLLLIDLTAKKTPTAALDVPTQTCRPDHDSVFGCYVWPSWKSLKKLSPDEITLSHRETDNARIWYKLIRQKTINSPVFRLALGLAAPLHADTMSSVTKDIRTATGRVGAKTKSASAADINKGISEIVAEARQARNTFAAPENLGAPRGKKTAAQARKNP